MTNFEMIQKLDSKELAWLLMNKLEGDSGCGFCIKKNWNEECSEDGISCIEGHKRFLEREVTDDDMVMYLVAHNNEVVTMYNAMPDREKYKIDYMIFNGKRYANVISLIDK